MRPREGVDPFGEETNLILEIDPQYFGHPDHRIVAVLSTTPRLQTKRAVDFNSLAHLVSQHTQSVRSSYTKLRKIVCARVPWQKNCVCHRYRDRKIMCATGTVTEKLCVPQVPWQKNCVTQVPWQKNYVYASTVTEKLCATDTVTENCVSRVPWQKNCVGHEYSDRKLCFPRVPWQKSLCVTSTMTEDCMCATSTVTKILCATSTVKEKLCATSIVTNELCVPRITW